MRLTVFSPSWMTSSSFVAQYVPRRYSNTYTGTFAPSLTNLVKSLRTTRPAKCRFRRSSRLVSTAVVSEIIGKGPINHDVHPFLFDPRFRVSQHEVARRVFVVRAVPQHQRYPFLALIHVTRRAVEGHRFDVG